MEYKLYHSGIKGMKWGVRRYQNKDGTLTPAGKRRARKQAASENAHPDYKRAHDKKPVSQMSDQELRERNNRLQAEKQYSSLTRKTSKGKKAVNAFIASAGVISGVVGAAATYKTLADKAIKKVGPTVIKKTPTNVKSKVAGAMLAREISKYRP